jgi:hypothetical protein
MRVTYRTDTELVIKSFVNREKLIFPGGMLSVAVVGLGIAVLAGEAKVLLVLFLVLVGAWGGKMLYDELTTETLMLDKTVDQIRYTRKAPLSSKHWQLPISTLQDVSVVNFKRRHKKADGNTHFQWFYSLKFVAQNGSPQELLYSLDGDGMNSAYRTIREFLEATDQNSQSLNSSTNSLSGKGVGRVVTSAYERWRETMFALQPEQAGGPSNERDRVYGVLMDVGMLDETTSELWAISMSAFLSGDASFSPTSGGAVIGLGNEPRVAEAARTIVQLAQTVLSSTSVMQDNALPDQPDLVQFFLLTPGGVYGVADYLKQLRNPSEPLSQIFRQFSLIRQFAEQRLDQR